MINRWFILFLRDVISFLLLQHYVHQPRAGHEGNSMVSYKIRPPFSAQLIWAYCGISSTNQRMSG